MRRALSAARRDHCRFRGLVHHRRPAIQELLLDPGARASAGGQCLHHHRRDRGDLRHHFRRHRSVDRIDDRISSASSWRMLDAAGWDPIVVILIWFWPLAWLYGAFQGFHHRFLRDPALHRHVVRTVSAAWRLLHGQSGLRAAAAITSSAGSTISISTCQGGGFLTGGALVMLFDARVLAIIIAHFTRFGTNVYATGGDQVRRRY